MDIQKKRGQYKRNFIYQNLPFYITGFLLLFCMKYYYSKAGVPELRWILAPTASWVTILSDIPFVYIEEAGYVNHDLKMIIAPSCSGVQFMLITAAMLIFSFVHVACRSHINHTGCPTHIGYVACRSCMVHVGCLTHIDHVACRIHMNHIGCRTHVKQARSNSEKHPAKTPRILKGFAWIVISLLLSYAFTICVNGLRIIIAVYLPLFLDRKNLWSPLLTPDRLHTAIGTVVYFASLLTIYQWVGCLFQNLAGDAHEIPFTAADQQQPGIPVQSSRRYPLSPYLCAVNVPCNGKDAMHRRVHKKGRRLLLKCLPPVFWYFFIVLGIPFLNSAYGKNGEQFTAFAMLVSSCCVGVLLLYWILLLLQRKADTRL